eukprot:169664_1
MAGNNQQPYTWTSLAARPCTKYVNILVLNDTELLLVPYSRDSHSLFKYDRITDKWAEWFDYSSTFGDTFETRYHTNALNEDKNMLYIYNEKGMVIEVNLVTHESIIPNQLFHDGSHIASLVIDNQFHIFGGWFPRDKAHFIWNKDAQTMDRVSEVTGIKDTTLRYHSAMYLKSIRSVLLSNVGHTNELYLYSLDRKECNLLPIQLPTSCVSSKCVATTDERYLLVFGGQSDIADHIHVVDLSKNTCHRSTIRCPKTLTGTKCEATIWNHTYECLDILIAGYVRRETDLHIPSDLYMFIGLLLNYENVHLFAIPDSDGSPLSHWSMNVDYIIANIDQ